jgi:hypothetical protein
MEPPRVWKTGESVRITCGGRTLDGEVLLASPNGVSLAVVYEGMLNPSGQLGGYLMMMPLLWRDGAFWDLGDLGTVALEEVKP